MRIRTPAKINTVLHVLARRPDGYHDLFLTYVPVSLYDEIAFELGAPPGIELTVAGAALPAAPRDNLVHRAAAAFYARCGLAPALRLRLLKRIPFAAGLGGGSGNAAGTLRALNHLHGAPLAPQALAGLARELGADVPFFLHPRPMLARGIGDELTPWGDLPPWPLLIVKPDVAIATAAAYGLVRPRARPDVPPPGRDLAGVLAHLDNDFEPALFPVHPLLARIKAALLAVGAAGALLSGSGSAVFGLFTDEHARDRAAARLAPQGLGLLLPCAVLSRHAYLPAGAAAP
ncbi:MAG: 4-(cytidine 5'-diphospho)-2-C-methyl-D-erythritol kinase [Candidatus Lambdaproteobacteria bacterium]|nr:4-(cytidine 5'-diphospho)-2-C-methyl-D-erythritol kinase [Candidatus Lambdaproteobacteria bacterium]